MRKALIFSILTAFTFFLITCKSSNNDPDNPPTPDPDPDPSNTPELKFTDAFPNLSFNSPVEMIPANDGTNRIFVVLQGGQIEVFENQANTNTKSVFLERLPQFVSGGERGLLGLAFHPNYKQNGFFYIHYNKSVNSRLQTVISRFKVSDNNPNRFDPDSELILLTFDQPFGNHNGGKIAFGNDGYLYIGSGDGGSGGDPQNNSQTFSNLLGKILRIDVNNREEGKNYAIPADNPFKGNNQGFREEIYAPGFRNPWKFCVDKTTGQIWVADVGQGQLEEIDILEKGKNYGWRKIEGNLTYNANDPTPSNLVAPIWVYGRQDGISITGGYVYRGQAIENLAGKYIYGDYSSGKVWVLTYKDNKATNKLVFTTPFNISSFGEDGNGEVYICEYSGNGKLYKIEKK
jgi:glucose/arabinose dehydrogenase